MKRRTIISIIAGLFIGCATAVVAQIAISQLPTAGLPLVGGEVVPGVQSGATVKIPAWSILSPFFSFAAGYPNIPTPYGLVIGSPSGGNQGAGTINVATAYYQNGLPIGAAGYTNAILFTGTGNITATTTPTRYYLAKATPAATTITLPAASNWPNCPSQANACPTYFVKDFKANSGTYAITVTAADGATFVAGNTASTSYVIQSNGAANAFTLVGTSWSVE